MSGSRARKGQSASPDGTIGQLNPADSTLKSAGRRSPGKPERGPEAKRQSMATIISNPEEQENGSDDFPEPDFNEIRYTPEEMELIKRKKSLL